MDGQSRSRSSARDRTWGRLARRAEDGRGENRCRDRDVLAFTQRGDRSVWICPRQFIRASEGDPAYAEIVLIHEELHALGLGEDPPSSQAISRRVEARCGGGSAVRDSSRNEFQR